MANDADGFSRVNMVWTIEGRTGVKTGTLYGLHEMELENAKIAVARRARRGDTVDIRVV